MRRADPSHPILKRTDDALLARSQQEIKRTL